MKKYKTLESWVREALSDSEKDSVCTAMSLVYKPDVGGSKEIDSLLLEGKTHDPATIAARFQGKAEAHSQDSGGLQHFEILAFYGKNKSEPQAFHPFSTMDGEIHSGGASRGVRETPDGPGLIAQAMKHAERAYDQLDTYVKTMYQVSLQRETASNVRIQDLEKEVTDGFVIIREMLMKDMDRAAEHQMKQLEFERSTKERELLMRFGPALLNTVSGREIFPQGTADTALIELIADKIDPKAVEQLFSAGVLPKELQGPLMIRLGEIKERRKIEAQSVKQLPPTSSDPREDAGGGASIVKLVKDKK